MRPNSQTLQKLARKVRGDVYIYSVPAGTQLPEHLILVHEFRDHFSLQARMEMTVEDLNAHITHFLTMQGECLTRGQWLHGYPQATYFWK
ncbi:hypothetical protein I7I48_08616 [Histoplasma ohiense]|nr:hypothetical protein I7I48_08616 [Histoplasma ohiense (nom. inval.)]